MLICVLALSWFAAAQEGIPDQQPAPQAAQAESPSLPCVDIEESSSQHPSRRIPEERDSLATAALLGMIRSYEGVALPGVLVELKPAAGTRTISTQSGNDGIIRLPGIPPGSYQIIFNGSAPCRNEKITFNAGEALVVEVKLRVASGQANAHGIPEKEGQAQVAIGNYQELFRRPVREMQPQLEVVPASKYAAPKPDRWDILACACWDRFEGRKGEFPYASSHWWDPFNTNRLKGDKPIIGQSTFLNVTANSTTAVDIRRLFVPSGVSAANPGNSQFFGNGGQAFLEETARFSFDLFHGDTSFKPIDWRIKITPAFNVNQLWTRERGIVSIDVREGTSRTDGHIGIQEAFVEKKLANLGPNYDFLSIRAGVQQFSSDFRGLLFTQEQPGVRLFGNLRSNRLQYNAAYFFFLEKDTNSGLNTLNSRHQQVMLANFYIQDFFFKGYTTQFSYHYNKDDASVHFDDNGFLVRPAPIGFVVSGGAVQPHNIRAQYAGWTSNGHIGRFNISHAFYQAFGYDSFNLFARRKTHIDAQLAALEVSRDYDWVRLHTSAFFTSGDGNPRDGTATGFDAISESQEFAGGIFSFFNREGIRLTGTGVALVAPDSFLPNLRSSKEEGQANFVNPGIFLVNAGADFNITPTLKAVTNVNYMRFNRTEPLEFLLFQSHIDRSLGTDYGVGVIYRPALSENMVITGGVAALTPGLGLHQIYTGRTLVSAFSTVRFKF